VEEQDERITVALFRIGEVYLKQRLPDVALAVFESLRDAHADDRYGKEAESWVTFAEEIRQKLEENPWLDPMKNGDELQVAAALGVKEVVAEALV